MTDEQASKRGLPTNYDVRPPWATHRIISSLSLSWSWPEDPRSKSYGMIVWLDRDGQAVRTPGDNGAGKPRHKLRTIDLREGDEVMTLGGRWATLRELYVYRGQWLTAEQAAANTGEGYAYELPVLTAPAATEPSA
jgi:hypothetical protein